MKRGLSAAGATTFLTFLLVPASGLDWVNLGPTATPQRVTTPAPEVSSNGRFVAVAPTAQNSDGGSPTSGPTLGLEYVYIDPPTYTLWDYPWYGDTSSMRWQCLYLQDSIKRGGTIHEIALFKDYYGEHYHGTFPNVTVKMANVTTTSLGSSASGNYGGATPVRVFHSSSLYRGGVPDWDPVTLQTDFDYDYAGGKNLLVELTWQGSASGQVYNEGTYVSYVGLAYYVGSGDTTYDSTNTSHYIINTRIGFVPPANNVGVTAILEPHERNYPYGDTIFPKCIVKNFGSAEQDSVPVQCKINDSATGETVYYQVVYIASLAPDAVDTVNTFPGYLPPPTEATYVDTMRTENPGDARPGDDMQQLEFVVSLSGVMTTSEPIVNATFAISPNPLMSGLATVRYNLPEAGLATLSVFDVTGRTVYEQTLAAGRSGTASLDLRKLGVGVYLVKVATEGFSTTQKLVIE